MSFDWTEFLNLANSLAENKTSQAHLRSSVSRSYYALFNTAKSIANERGLTVPKEDSHTTIWNHFTSQDDKALKSVGANGFRLKALRVKADYKGSEDVKHTEASDSCKLAKNMIDKLKKPNQS